MSNIISFAPAKARARSAYVPTPAARAAMEAARSLPKPKIGAAQLYDQIARGEVETMLGSGVDAAYGRLQFRLGVVLNGLRRLRGTDAAKASILAQLELLEQLDARDSK